MSFDYEYDDDGDNRGNLFGSDDNDEFRDREGDYEDDYFDDGPKLEATFRQQQDMTIQQHDLIRDCTKPNKLTPAEKLACKISEISQKDRISVSSNIYNIVMNTPFPDTKNPLLFIIAFQFIEKYNDFNLKNFNDFFTLKSKRNNIDKTDLLRYANLIKTIIQDCQMKLN